MSRKPLIAIGVVALVLLAGCSGALSAADSNADSPSSSGSQIEVAGAGSADGQPNRAVVDVGVTATAEDAVTARQRLAENVSRMRRALTEAGVADEQITTSYYDIGRDYRPPREEGGEPEVRYRATHEFEITLPDVGRAGPVIDTAVQNGATDINNVEFTLSAERRQQLERDARQAAMADARRKAETVGATENLTITGVDVIRVDSGSPRPSDVEYATQTPAPDSGDTDVEAGSVTVVASVQVVYNATAT
ncbi:SIMPL domain-containing protein [Halobellus litoreus]|uniref:SIMPL domain-containing protein n=1 Tax=Halobellus litoreus TaxID=755310 RepID=A0ABD6DTQ1_9EURY|nr:SIMPL domain-containing protein [Halobellus litoreus]